MTNSKSGKKKEMIITDGMRLKLTERARDVFKEEGEILMQHLPVGGNSVVATKTDLEISVSRVLYKQTWKFFGAVVVLNSLLFAVMKWG